MKKIILFLFVLFSSSASASTFSDMFLCLHKSSKIIINQNIIYAVNACNQKEQERGLMFIKKLPQNSGMLFIFGKKQILKFWMKNTYIPLDIAFINKHDKIVHIATMKPFDENITSSIYPSAYALEINANWFRNHSVHVGDTIKINW